MSIGRPTEFASAIGRSLVDKPFTLLDFGCSGGINPMWRVFGDRLLAFGFDPNIEECEQLNAQEKSNSVEYIAAFVGKPGSIPIASQRTKLPWSRLPAHRFSYLRTQEIRAKEIDQSSMKEKTRLNEWHKTNLVDQKNVLSPLEFIETRGLTHVDFIKIDIDGLDFELLQVVEPAFAPFWVLGCVVEVTFFGSEASDENTFHNVDRLMKRAGFELFDLTMRRYSTRFLPGRYLHIPAEAEYGRIYQGDALYLRDICQDDWRSMANKITPEPLLKLAALFSMFNLPDCAAEVLIKFQDRISRRFDIRMGLDLLAAQAQPNLPKANYEGYMAAFERDAPYFYCQAPTPDSTGELDTSNGVDGYDLTNRIVQSGATCKVDECEMHITTPEAQWAYAVKVPRSVDTCSQDLPVKATISVKIKSGTIGVGILNIDETAFLIRKSIPADCERATVSAPSEKAGALVFLNESPVGPTHATIRVLKSPESLQEQKAGKADCP
jgi:hypothetical protein